MASSSERTTEVLNQFSIDEVILWLNAQGIGDWFVCYGCGDLTRGEPFDLCTTTSGDQQCFCSSCIIFCYGCEKNYCSHMAWFHDDCGDAQFN